MTRSDIVHSSAPFDLPVADLKGSVRLAHKNTVIYSKPNFECLIMRICNDCVKSILCFMGHCYIFPYRPLQGYHPDGKCTDSSPTSDIYDKNKWVQQYIARKC